MTASLVRVPRPAEINRLLIILTELDVGDGVARTALFEGMTSVCLGGELPGSERTLAFAEATGLVKRSRGRWRVTELGAALLTANPGLRYEPTAAQLPLMAKHCILAGAYAGLAQRIISQFRMRADSETWALEAAQGVELDLVERSLVSFMLAVGVLQPTAGGIQVTPGYVATASWLRSGRSVSPDELADALERQRSQGARAEEWVVAYERRRLEAACCPAEAHAVRQVSLVDVCVGYDIGSFGGPSGTLAYDRFIEVKSTASSSVRFFWTANEVAAAEQLGAHYWLYIVMYAERKPTALVRVANPASLIGQPGGIVLDPAVYRCRLEGRARREAV